MASVGRSHCIDSCLITMATPHLRERLNGQPSGSRVVVRSKEGVHVNSADAGSKAGFTASETDFIASPRVLCTEDVYVDATGLPGYDAKKL